MQKVYHVEVTSNMWRYSAAAGDIECATILGALAVKDFDEWEMNISCTVIVI